MKVIIFGATGMVGQAMLAQCLGDAGIGEVVVVGRSPVGRSADKLREILHPDFTDFSALAPDFAGADACFFCLGVSSVRMKEPEYRRITKDITLSAATVLAAAAPQVVFLYISGMGTDSSEHGRVMWARVKGETENALLAMPFSAYAIRPGFIQAVGGVRSKTPLYAALYRV
ncbi:MAG: NAD(P)H-binding protein, partial [Nakamurella sp.]